MRLSFTLPSIPTYAAMYIDVHDINEMASYIEYFFFSICPVARFNDR